MRRLLTAWLLTGGKPSKPFWRCSVNIFPGVSISTGINNVFRHQLATAPLIIGLRRPDDVTDTVHHRNGKFINNVFVPAESTVSIAVNEEKK